MIPSSAIQIVQQTPTRLVILAPPYYLVGWSFIVLSLIGGGLLFVFSTRGPSRQGGLWMTGLIALPFLLIGVASLMSHTTATFSREDRVVFIESVRFGVDRHTRTMPLEDIRSAVVETGRNTRRLVLVLNSGEVINLSLLSDQGGQYTAANAINDFLRKPN